MGNPFLDRISKDTFIRIIREEVWQCYRRAGYKPARKITMSRNKREGCYQGAVKRFGDKWGDQRVNREGTKVGKRHIRSTVIPDEPMCEYFRGAKAVSIGAALNVLSYRYQRDKRKSTCLIVL